MRGINACNMTARAFAADTSPATSGEIDWDQMNKVAVCDEGRRAVAQMRKTVADMDDMIAKERAKVRENTKTLRAFHRPSIYWLRDENNDGSSTRSATAHG